MTRKNLFAHTADLPVSSHPSTLPEVKPRSTEADSAPRARVKAIGNLGALLSDMSHEARRAADLQRDLAGAERVVEIEPNLIDPSPIRDRLEDPASEDNRALLESISRDGQRVPALLRPHPSSPGRYITIFGHRRIAQVRKLGRLVRAIIADMNEEDAFVAQGQENNARLNTSFIERAMFAKRLNDHGMKIVRIADALNVVKSVVSESIAVASALPEPLLEAIGPAPAVGRARWQALAKRIERNVDWRSIVGDPSFATLPSNQRFERITSEGGVNRSSSDMAFTQQLVDDDGCYMKVRRTSKAVTYAIPLDDAAAREDGLSFADWIEGRIPKLREEYRKGK
jgi:ParB family transcriptional regulator, chromosome partitioning protein